MKPVRVIVSLAAALAARLLAGCAAGYPPPKPAAEHTVTAPAASRTPAESAPKPVSAQEALEKELFLSDPGRVVGRAIRAHGGWDAWLKTGRVSYTLVDGAPRRVDWAVDAAGKVAPANPGQALEALVAALPFSLADPAQRLEYLGVEIDHKSGELLERLRWSRGAAPEGEWCSVAFDRSTWILKRLLIHDALGGLTHTSFSDLREVNGIRLAATRSVHVLRSAFDHFDPNRPDRVETIADLERGE